MELMEMESVGSRMRAARLRLGLTVEQVSATTRISVNVLQGIETDDPSKIGSAFLYKSFVRQFAEYLHLEIKHLEPALQAVVNTIPEPLIPGQGTSLPKLPPLQASHPKRLRWLSSVASLLLMMVGCSGFYGMWQSARKQAAPDLLAQPPKRVRTPQPVEAPATPPNTGRIDLVVNTTPFGISGERRQNRTVELTGDGYEVLQPAAPMALMDFSQIGEWPQFRAR